MIVNLHGVSLLMFEDFLRRVVMDCVADVSEKSAVSIARVEVNRGNRRNILVIQSVRQTSDWFHWLILNKICFISLGRNLCSYSYSCVTLSCGISYVLKRFSVLNYLLVHWL